MLDNGAYSTWTRGASSDWSAWALWVEPWIDYRTTWCVLPDSIDGGHEENERLIKEWSWVAQGAPVWHLDEPIERLVQLACDFERVCFGSSGAYRTIGTEAWHRRVSDAFDAIASPAGRVPWVHMLRGMALAGDVYPFSSADSVNVARNFKGSHAQRARPIEKMVAEIDSVQCPPRWAAREQLALT